MTVAPLAASGKATKGWRRLSLIPGDSGVTLSGDGLEPQKLPASGATTFGFRPTGPADLANLYVSDKAR